MRILTLLGILVYTLQILSAQEIPTVYSNIGRDEKGVFMIHNNKKIWALPPNDMFSFTDMYGNPEGNTKGIFLDFRYPVLKGVLYYGFINYDDGMHPQPVYFRNNAQIVNGKAFINISGSLSGIFDMVGWQKSGKGVLGYRIVNNRGEFIYDGRVAFSYNDGIFNAECTVVEGPLINNLTSESVIISFTTSQPIRASIEVDGKIFRDKKSTVNHEIKIKGLTPNRSYNYSLSVEPFEFDYSFSTPPTPGSRIPFTFAYASDSRTGQGGGERAIWGTNAYIMKRIAALATAEKAKFVQFTGDMINGYETSRERVNLEYANWKHSVEPFWHYIPFITAMGNHEAYVYAFHDPETDITYQVDHFPFRDDSSESLFQDNFVHPSNGPISEDGSQYDPTRESRDFPSYKESVFWYKYDNVAMVVLNSDYWYAPYGINILGGNLHAFIMNNQYKWLKKTLSQLEKDENTDHIFITLHTPFFPNGGHVSDDMWYGGNNNFRPYVNAKGYKTGIIERRDQLLDLIINKSSKTVAILTGDEHNYNLLTITNDMKRYPPNYQHAKVDISRTFYQINNGSAGAPYYAQEQTPWMDHLRNFSTQNALVLIDVDGKKVSVRVKNPDTLEVIDIYTLR